MFGRLKIKGLTIKASEEYGLLTFAIYDSKGKIILSRNVGKYNIYDYIYMIINENSISAPINEESFNILIDELDIGDDFKNFYNLILQNCIACEKVKKNERHKN